MRFTHTGWGCFVLALVACKAAMPDAPEPAWQERPGLPEMRRRLEASAAASGARLVVLGGFTTSPAEVPPQEITREILQFDPFAQAWTALDVEAPEAWSHAGLVGIGGSLYLLGGLAGTTFVPSGNTYRLRPGATAWESLAPMPAGMERGAAAIVASEGHIFLFGGETEDGPVATVLDYVIADDRWQALPALITPRTHAAAMRMEDGTFVVAGGIGLAGPLGDVITLPVGATTWQLREPMPTRRGGCAYGVIYGQLVCAGGEIDGGATTRVVEVYDPTLNVWTTKPEMPVERAGAAAAVVTSRLYVVGGAPSLAREPTGTVFEFDLLDTIAR